MRIASIFRSGYNLDQDDYYNWGGWNWDHDYHHWYGWRRRWHYYWNNCSY